MRKTYENATSNASKSQKHRQRAQKAEVELREFQTKLTEKEAELEEILKLNPQETQKQLQEIAREKATLAAKLKIESEKLTPLQERIAKFEKTERDAAQKLGVRPEAIRDVERLASAFSVAPNDDSIRDASGRDVSAVVAEELKASPHWLPASQGGGSTGSNVVSKSDEQRVTDAFDSAEKNGDIFTMVSTTLR